MKKIKFIVFMLAIAISLMGCTSIIEPLSTIEEIILEDELKAAEAIPNIGFTKGTVHEFSENIIMTASDFTNYQSEYNVYSSSLHYQTLNDEEKQIYHAMEYAMENSYESILVEKNLVDNIEDLDKIINYLSLDSPLLEQNLFYETGTVSTYHDVDVGGTFKHQAVLEGYYITIQNFSQQWWDKKLTAIAAAEKIIESLPQNLTKLETAETLYFKLSTETEYALSEELLSTQVQPNLYDAFITKKTQCDGFSNALSLLYNMAGITCSEKLYHAIGDELGHTWNFFEIDGKWYNADAANSSLIPTDRTDMHNGIYFGFPDILQGKKHIYSYNYPKCTEALYISTDVYCSDINDESFVTNAYAAYESHSRNWALILLDSYDEESAKNQLNKLANKLKETVYYISFDVLDNKTALLLHKEGLINYIDQVNR